MPGVAMAGGPARGSMCSTHTTTGSSSSSAPLASFRARRRINYTRVFSLALLLSCGLLASLPIGASAAPALRRHARRSTLGDQGSSGSEGEGSGKKNSGGDGNSSSGGGKAGGKQGGGGSSAPLKAAPSLEQPDPSIRFYKTAALCRPYHQGRPPGTREQLLLRFLGVQNKTLVMRHVVNNTQADIDELYVLLAEVGASQSQIIQYPLLFLKQLDKKAQFISEKDCITDDGGKEGEDDDLVCSSTAVASSVSGKTRKRCGCKKRGEGSGGAAAFPKLLHLSFKDKKHFRWDHMISIASWAKLNPGHNILLYDDGDLAEYFRRYFPALVKTFEALPHPVMKSDFWRYMVVCKHGGVYADADTVATTPVDQWEAKGDLVTGVENVILPGNDSVSEPGFVPSTVQFVQWAFAGQPGHPVPCSCGELVRGNVERWLAWNRRKDGAGEDEEEEEGGGGEGEEEDEHPPISDSDILTITGPLVWTRAVTRFLKASGVAPATAVPGRQVGTVTVLDQVKFGCNTWFFNPNRTGQAYMYHIFRGSWRSEAVDKSFSGDKNKKRPAAAPAAPAARAVTAAHVIAAARAAMATVDLTDTRVLAFGMAVVLFVGMWLSLYVLPGQPRGQQQEQQKHQNQQQAAHKAHEAA